MSRIFVTLCVVSALLQLGCTAASPKRIVFVFGNQFEGEKVVLTVGTKFRWEGELTSKPELGCAKIVTGEVSIKPLDIAVSVGQTSASIRDVELSKGKYVIINFDPVKKVIDIRQTDKRPSFLIEDP